MHPAVPPNKPIITLMDAQLSPRPAKNYIRNLLFRDIASLRPTTSLDAGAGDLANYWMFPGKYCGVGKHLERLKEGIAHAHNKKFFEQRGFPSLYRLDLDKDISFLGPFDLCVCTETIFYLDDPVSAVRRLIDTVRQGGNLIMDDRYLDRFDDYVDVLSSSFQDVTITFWGFDDLMRLKHVTNNKMKELSETEMRAPNIQSIHSALYIKATNKHAPSKSSLAPPMVNLVDGIRIL